MGLGGERESAWMTGERDLQQSHQSATRRRSWQAVGPGMGKNVLQQHHLVI